MIQLETIVSSLRDTVKFPEVVDPDIPQIDTSMTSSATARPIYHPLLSAENIYLAAAPDFSNYPAAPNPTLNNLFSDWLYRLRDDAIRQCVMDVYNTRKSNGQAREQLSNLALYEGQGSNSDTVVAAGRLAGFEIRPVNNNGIFLELPKVGIQLTQAQTLTLHLYNSERNQRISSHDIVYTDAYSMQWLDLGVTLKNRDVDNNIVGGVFYIMYDEDTLAGQSINKQHTWGVRPCGNCSRYNREAWDKYSRYFYMRPVYVSAANKPGDLSTIFDTKNVSRTNRQNWGLNFIVNSGCDLTQYFIDRKGVFSDAISRQLSVILLQYITNTTRSNTISEKIREKARFALQNRELAGEGAMEDLSKAKKALALELSDTERNVCSPRQPAKGFQYHSIQTR